MPDAIRPSTLILSAYSAFATRCLDAPAPEPPAYTEAAGDYALQYSPGWKVYEDGVLVGQVMPGQGGMVALSEGTLHFDALCGGARPLCPEKALWGDLEISESEGWYYGGVLWAYNRDPDVGKFADERLGLVEFDGVFELSSSGDPALDYLASASISGTFVEGFIYGGLITWKLEPGLAIAGLVIDQEVRLEAEFTAQRVAPVLLAA
jgi:hypothetical protein